MILEFSTQLNGKPTNFVEKIWDGLIKESISNFEEMWEYENRYENEIFDLMDFNKADFSKFHTIREDKTGRWKVGTKIDFFINCRQPTMFRFAPVLQVVSIQNIYITYTATNKAMVFIDDVCFYMQNLSVEGNHKMLHLAQNDGFDTIQDFFEYFSEDFKGKIIHWTDLRY
jgi:hypothetical protein